MLPHPGLRRAADDGCRIKVCRLVQRSNGVRLVIHFYNGTLGRSHLLFGE